MFKAVIAAILLVLAGVAPGGADDAPKLKFIPICETLPPGSGTIECISQASVDNQERMVAWRGASLKLRQCEEVIVDPAKPKVSTNIGFRCNGILTGAGLIPDSPTE
ncbi:MAG TPA: hypothetical protein VHL10_07140 [Nitrososphaera sp.]|jgi:hypothetical protein|nr:hypothetical protein [Nitrososphaera sp.]